MTGHFAERENPLWARRVPSHFGGFSGGNYQIAYFPQVLDEDSE